MVKCKDCAYYNQDYMEGEEERGTCRLAPPERSLVGKRWPTVYANDWCGGGITRRELDILKHLMRRS